MSSLIARPLTTEVHYPDSDGEPMSDNTLQWQWIVTIKENLELQFQENPDVFVAGNLLWYPVEGDSKTRTGPDVLVVFGRPKGYRGSYMQWKEDGIAPQVVFEILSPGNRIPEMLRKHRFYEDHGVDEYYVYDPDANELVICLREGDRLKEVPFRGLWTSPRLGVGFEHTPDGLRMLRKDGMPFLTWLELARKAETDAARAEAEAARAEAEAARAEAERQRADRLAEQLRALGVTPDA